MFTPGKKGWKVELSNHDSRDRGRDSDRDRYGSRDRDRGRGRDSDRDRYGSRDRDRGGRDRYSDRSRGGLSKRDSRYLGVNILNRS